MKTIAEKREALRARYIGFYLDTWSDDFAALMYETWFEASGHADAKTVSRTDSGGPTLEEALAALAATHQAVEALERQRLDASQLRAQIAEAELDLERLKMQARQLRGERTAELVAAGATLADLDALDNAAFCDRWDAFRRTGFVDGFERAMHFFKTGAWS